eukprot:jgi/Phyca11/104952/e_gw1.10.537.1
MGFNLWLARRTIDANAAQLGAFAVFLWRYGMNKSGNGNTYSTICSKLCAIRWFHKHTAGYDPGVNAGHAILLRGIRRFTDPVVKQQPVTPALLRTVYRIVDLRSSRSQLLWGGLLLAYFFLLRRSEYLFIGKKHHQYILRLGDITFQDITGKKAKPREAVMVGIRLSGAKNNQFGREERRVHHRSGDDVLCPVKGARWVLKGARSHGTKTDQPALSTTGKRTGITADDMTAVLKRAARTAGLDASLFSTHSVRIGGATALMNAGADRLVIKVMGFRTLTRTIQY